MPTSASKRILPGCLLIIAACVLAACAPQSAASQRIRGYTLTRCANQQVVPSRTGVPQAAPPAVYVSSAGANLYAFSPTTGALDWCNHVALTPTAAFYCEGHDCPPPASAYFGQPLLDHGILYVCVSGAGGYTYAFNAADGSLRWQRRTNCGDMSMAFEDYAVPIVSHGILYAGQYALDAANGNPLWQAPVADISFGALANGLLYGYASQTLYAINAADDTLRWSENLSDDISNLPSAANGTVYIGDLAGTDGSAIIPGVPDFFALNAADGALRWQFATGSISGSAATVANGSVYIGSAYSDTLYALDAATGQPRWSIQTGAAVASTPQVSAGLVYITADGAYAIDAATGALRWHNPLGANQDILFTPPTLLNGILYLGATDEIGAANSTLYALNASTGAERWQQSGINPLSPPTAG